jgi:parallel beta-helix repeat protein
VLLTGCSAPALEPEPLAIEAQALTACVRPVANLVVRSSTTLCPGTYTIGDPEGDGVIQVKANNVELTISGVTLAGAGTGYGITASGVNGVSIKSAATNRGKIQGFQAAILVEGGASHQISENVLSFNAKRPLSNSDADFLSVWDEWPEQLARGQIGNGIVLRNVVSATITNNQMRFQQNGISLFGSSNVTIRGNDCSDNQGWGIHLHRSSNNTVTGNRADNVNLAASVYCHDVQADACDTAGILVIKASNDNLIQGNSFKSGGDGIFSAARQGDIQFGADHNRYIGNDVSRAKHLGIEATFANGLFVENNTVVGVGRSGIWLGGSRSSTIRGNAIAGSGWSGIENEGAQDITIELNLISSSAQQGILLRGAAFGPSAGYFIARNTVRNNGQYGLHAEDTNAMTTTGNLFSGNGLGSVQLELRRQSALSGPISINESQLLDASRPCGGVDVKCGCPVFNGNIVGCDAAAGCAYYSCSNQCRAVGTSLCDAGCSDGCTSSCRDHDGDVEACDAAGGCAYYFCSNRCYPTGTPLSEACPCRDHDGDPTDCAATPACAFYACSNQCHFAETPPCQAGCADACPGGFDCPIGNVTDVTSNWWGTTDPNLIDAAICGATLKFTPFKNRP